MNGELTLSIELCGRSGNPSPGDRENAKGDNPKLSAQPMRTSRDVQGRQFYMCSPDYMAKYAKRLIQAGTKLIGGCCGTTPAHIKLIADSVRAAGPRKNALTFSTIAPAKVAALAKSEIVTIPLKSGQNGRGRSSEASS